MANRKRRRASPLLGACAGAAAGLIASWAMVRFNHLINPGNGPSDKLAQREKLVGGSILHYLFGATAGSLYGAAAEVDDSTTRAAGLPYGVTVWLVADEIGMHASGYAIRRTDYPLSRHASTLATHLIFGLTLEAVRRALRGRPARF